MFLLVMNIRNSQINLRNELLYLHIFIMYMGGGGSSHRQYLVPYAKVWILFQFFFLTESKEWH